MGRTRWVAQPVRRAGDFRMQLRARKFDGAQMDRGLLGTEIGKQGSTGVQPQRHEPDSRWSSGGLPRLRRQTAPNALSFQSLGQDTPHKLQSIRTLHRLETLPQPKSSLIPASPDEMLGERGHSQGVQDRPKTPGLDRSGFSFSGHSPHKSQADAGLDGLTVLDRRDHLVDRGLGQR